MRKILIVGGSLVALVCLSLVAVFYLTSGLVETADSFFTKIAQRDMQGAQSFLAKAFIAETSSEELITFLEQSDLDSYERARWSSRSMNFNTGELSGAVVSSSGAEIPIKLALIREEGSWKIYSIERPASGLLHSESSSLKLPSAEESADLVQTITQLFAEAVATKDFSRLRAASATPFQRKFSAEEFRDLFAVYIEKQIDLRVLSEHEPLFTVSPALSAQGYLHLEGYYPTRPSQAHFSYDFVQEDGVWRLISIDFEVRPTTDS